MVIRDGLLALPNRPSLVRCDVRIEDGRFVEIGDEVAPRTGETCIDATGLHLFPGAVDPHVHFDTPGFEWREDFEHGSAAAARGGVTCVVDMPDTSLPPVTSTANLREKLAGVEKRSVVDFALYGGVSGIDAKEIIDHHMIELAPFVVGFKAYFLSGMKTFTHIDHYEFARAVERAAELGRPLLLHAEDLSYVTAATRAIRARAAESTRAGYASDATFGTSSPANWADYVESRPEAAERVAAAAALALSHGHESTLHVVHVGTADAAAWLSAGGATCETCPHYLAFSSGDFDIHGSALKTAPPVKSPGEAARLWGLLAGGAVAFVASDHAPAPRGEKHTGSVWTDYGGIPGTGTLFPYLYSEGFRAGRLSLQRFLSSVSSASARRFGLSGRKGSIEVGKDADIVFVDPDGDYVVKGDDLLSKGTITPFEGMRFRGSIRATYVRGVKVWDASDGVVVDPGSGMYLKWGCA